MRYLASTALLLAAIGCSSPTDDLSRSLQEGQAALHAMTQAAKVRNHDEYFNQYDILRRSYIDLATMLQSGNTQADRIKVLDVLNRWEIQIATARAAWANLNTPHIDVQFLALRPEMLRKLEKLDEAAAPGREQINREWAQKELRLDDSIVAVQTLRDE